MTKITNKSERTQIMKKRGEALSLDEMLPNAGGSMFTLARMAMQRATDIYFGSKPLVDHHPLEKETTIALREIAQGEIVSMRRPIDQ